MTDSLSEAWLDESRECELRCDDEGLITWHDRRAAQLLGARPGVAFVSLSVPGTEDKTRALLQRARSAPVASWEISLLSQDRPSTWCFAAQRGQGQDFLLFGRMLPDHYGETVQQLSESMQEVLTLNREISRQKKQLQNTNVELGNAYRELSESNRGVMSLHAELAERNDTLRRTSEVKTRVVANVSHEFRTPLHTILGLSRLLLEGSDGPLLPEQEKQVRFIRTAAEELSALVNDLLDLSKAESGRAILRPTRFGTSELFAALRGMLRPLVPENTPVMLVFDEPAQPFELDTDQPKLTQVLRNLVSNALKFTEQGQVRIGARMDKGVVSFTVSDTGIGIAAKDHERIFEEFGQVDSHLQAKHKGTGLGLPLSRKLAELLGGSLRVDSQMGKGSTFTLEIPQLHPEVRELDALEQRPLDPARAPVLVLEDDRKTIFIYEKFLSMAGFQVVPARSVDSARKLIKDLRPAAVVLDIMLEGESSWAFLAELKRDPKTADIPVLVVTVSAKEQKARALGADEFWLKPVDQDRLLRKLKSLSAPGAVPRVLVIDDDERARYLLRKLLDRSPYELMEASTGPLGVKLAREQRPGVILLDFLLEDMTAFDVLDELKSDPLTRAIPVVVVTSHALDRGEVERLATQTEAILSKDNLSRELALNRIRDALQKAGVGTRHGPSQGESDAAR